ncbi:EAL domain-containing protein [Isosphaeraceae bacterium EP7]
MSQCSRCAVTPAPLPESGTLFVSLPLAHTQGKIRSLLTQIELGFEATGSGLLGIPIAPGVLPLLARSLAEVLSLGEQADAKTLILRDGACLSIDDLTAMQPLGTLLARIRGNWLIELLKENRMVSHFQPIVRAGDPEVVFAQECLLRGLGDDGSLIPPDRLYRAAREADLMFPLDRAARLTAIRSAAAQGLDRDESRLFINFNPTAIYDPNFCLRTTVAALNETAFRPERVVFEIVESDRIEDLGHLRRIVHFYREAGFKVALDDLGSGFGSLKLLAELRPDFVKLDMELIRGVDGDSYKAGIVAKLLELARDLGIETVAEGIETEGESAWVRDHGADYMQGYFFARPTATPARSRHPAVASL